MTELEVSQAHRPDCAFGPGFFRITLQGDRTRYCQTEREVKQVHKLLGDLINLIERDGHCLDGDRTGDANTPDVVDAEQWLALPMRTAMAQVGLHREQDYARVYRQVELAVVRRSMRESQTGIHVPIVIKKAGRPLIDVLATEEDIN